MELKVGTLAPDFSSVDQMGKEVKLSQYRGSPVVLYFYPKDDTPGCTTEACNFRDNNAEFQKRGIKVLGVSVDSRRMHYYCIYTSPLLFEIGSFISIFCYEEQV